mmetsp:Transcript_20377/g.58947  ORF Transcript_20377/g.58947 Transcript_20377/m.58947 type:complete len:115 (-) Transcript_20377:1328-1672(-)
MAGTVVCQKRKKGSRKKSIDNQNGNEVSTIDGINFPFDIVCVRASVFLCKGGSGPTPASTELQSIVSLPSEIHKGNEPTTLEFQPYSAQPPSCTTILTQFHCLTASLPVTQCRV